MENIIYDERHIASILSSATTKMNRNLGRPQEMMTSRCRCRSEILTSLFFKNKFLYIKMWLVTFDLHIIT